MEKEKIFDIIDEYMALKNEVHVIEITDRRKSKAFGIMMDAGDIRSYKRGEYCINGIIKRRLDKNKIKYKIKRR